MKDDYIQLNLFGDIIGNEDSEYDESVEQNGEGTLDQIPSKEGSIAKRTRNSGKRVEKGRGGSPGQDGGIDKQRSYERSSDGDNSTGVYPPSSGGKLTNRDFFINDFSIYNETSKVKKFDNNLESLKLIKKIESEKRFASSEEQKILSRYTGWGGLSKFFKPNLTGKSFERQNQLKSILTKDEYSAIERSTINAHFTPPIVTKSIWKICEKLGYKGGPTLEPAIGTGMFYGTRLSNLPIQMYGIELDPIAAKISQQLYQTGHIVISGYENIKIEENKFNLIISNVPFGNYKPYEDKASKTPGLDNKYSIHDFYFLKSIHGLKPGGLLAFVSSRYTLDKKDSSVREKIAEQADFIGAIRLPKNSFKAIADSEVVTDIIILQKRMPGTEMSLLTKEFLTTTVISDLRMIDLLKKSEEVELNQTVTNTYYHTHPEMIIGKESFSGTMYSLNEYTVEYTGNQLDIELQNRISNFPENILDIQIDDKSRHLEQNMFNQDLSELPLRAFWIDDEGQLYQKDQETKQLQLHPFYENSSKQNDISRIKHMYKIKETFKTALNFYYNGQEIHSHKKIEELNYLYDNFVNEYGYLRDSKNLKLFFEDPDSAILHSLENKDATTKVITKSDIFKGISFTTRKIEQPETPLDAMSISLSKYNHLNFEFMSSILKMEKSQIIDSLLNDKFIFPDPESFIKNNELIYLPSNEYLSGNIRTKLKIAEQAEKINPQLFSENLISLRKVLPADLSPENISIKLNSPIIGEHHVKNFLKELLQVNDIYLLHLKHNGKWEIKCNSWSAKNRETYGTNHLSADKIISCMMNGKPVRVYDKDEDGKLIINWEATEAAEVKAEKIKEEFDKWIWRDENRTQDIVKRYNIQYNSTVERSYTHPDRLSNPDKDIFFKGCAFPYPMRPNQADAVWRVLQNKNTLLAHAVGGGKTLEMTCAAMELRRLGIRSKPMIVCPDHLIEQWATAFRSAYPAANVLIADDANWTKKNRQVFINKIATGDWDCIIIRNRSFQMIDMSKDFKLHFFEQKKEEYQEILSQIDTRKNNNRSVKEIQKSLIKYELKVKELMDYKVEKGIIPFEHLGVDHLLVDESDLFKNLEYYTQYQNVRGLGTPTGSDRAFDMYMKIKYLQDKGGGITFATGTPISNTLVEAYTVQRYLQPEFLEKNNLMAFDEWARQFAEAVTQMELNNTGTGYKPVTRFSKIVNVPELMASLRDVWDIQTAKNLESNGILVPGVNLPKMKIINEAAPSTPILKSYLKYLEKRERKLSGKPGKGKDNILNILTDGRKAAIDMRFINPNLLDDPDSKLNIAVNRIENLYFEYANEGYTTVIFFDKARSYDKEGNLLFDGINDMKEKLVQKGIKEDEIGDVRVCKNYTEREMLFNKVDRGEVRIIFGSTESMGAGTNFQSKLKAILHIDVPWRPRDIEQQNGRGYRPGNNVDELLVYNFVTKGSLDTGLWHLLETKAETIRQIMDGTDKESREIEESYYGSVKELSIDDPLMKESVDLSNRIKKLELRQKAYHSESAKAARDIQIDKDIIAEKENELKIYMTDIHQRLPEKKGNDFEIQLENKNYTIRKEAGELIISELKNAYKEAKENEINTFREIGSYSGFPLFIETNFLSRDVFGKVFAKGEHKYIVNIVQENPDSLGIIKSLHHKIYTTPDQSVEFLNRHIKQVNKTLEENRKKAFQEFPEKEQLNELKKRYSDVLKKIQNQPKHITDVISFPWKHLDELSQSEISSLIEEKFGSNINSLSDFWSKIEQEVNFPFHQKMKDLINEDIVSNNIILDDNLVIKFKNIKDNLKYTWVEVENQDDYIFAYKSNPYNSVPGDVFIKKSISDNSMSTKYAAFEYKGGKILHQLGQSKDINSLKDRIETYKLGKVFKEVLNKKNSISKKNVLSLEY